MRRTALVAALALVLPGSATRAASAQQVSVGTEAVWGSDTGFGLGGRAILDLGLVLDGLATEASFDWFFPGPDLGVDATYREANANVVYAFGSASGIRPYTGTGLHVARFEASTRVLDTEVFGSETVVGFNLLAGFRFRFRRVIPFFETRVELGGGEQLVLAAGLRI